MRDGFFDEFDQLFKLAFSNFNRPVKDMQPYRYEKTDNGFIFVVNTLGIGKDDISVQINTQKGDPYRYLHVKGATKMEKINFQNSVDLAIKLRIDEEIENLAYEVKDGLTIIYIKLKKTVQPEITAKYIENSEELGF